MRCAVPRLFDGLTLGSGGGREDPCARVAWVIAYVLPTLLLSYLIPVLVLAPCRVCVICP